jgi:phosphate transport system permease protein
VKLSFTSEQPEAPRGPFSHPGYDRRRLRQAVFFTLFRVCAAIVVLTLVIILGNIMVNGLSNISWGFITEMPLRGGAQGGILPAIIGTLSLMLLVAAFSVPIGVFTAIYLVEYQKKGRMTGFIRTAVQNLAGVPSVVYGLLGLGLFVLALSLGSSLLAAGLTLSIMVLPLTITASWEAVSAVPPSLHEASLALGATRWQTIRHHILPYSASGILTGMILSISRAAGETAPIMLIGAAVAINHLPSGLMDSFMALPFTIFYFVQVSSAPNAYGLAYATALILIVMVVSLNLIAIVMRKKYREKYKW